MNKTYWTSFERFEFELTRDQVLFIPRSGSVDYHIRQLRQERGVSEQLQALSPVAVKEELSEYGAWDEDELQNHEVNLGRVLWIGVGDIQERYHEQLYAH